MVETSRVRCTGKSIQDFRTAADGLEQPGDLPLLVKADHFRRWHFRQALQDAMQLQDEIRRIERVQAGQHDAHVGGVAAGSVDVHNGVSA